MASTHQFNSEYASAFSYSELFAALMAGENDAAVATSSGSAFTSSSSASMWGDENYLYPILSPESDIGSLSSGPMMKFPNGRGTVNLANMQAITYNSNVMSSPQGMAEQYNDGEYQKEVCKTADGSSLFVPFRPRNPAAGVNSIIQHNLQVAHQESNIKVGRYTLEERKDKILRYLEKRNRRNFNKTIKYECRKTLADRRVRVRGRFARNNTETCEEEMLMKKYADHSYRSVSYHGDAAQIKLNEEEEWLQEMMGSLLYLPYMP